MSFQFSQKTVKCESNSGFSKETLTRNAATMAAVGTACGTAAIGTAIYAAVAPTSMLAGVALTGSLAYVGHRQAEGKSLNPFSQKDEEMSSTADSDLTVEIEQQAEPEATANKPSAVAGVFQCVFVNTHLWPLRYFSGFQFSTDEVVVLPTGRLLKLLSWCELKDFVYDPNALNPGDKCVITVDEHELITLRRAKRVAIGGVAGFFAWPLLVGGGGGLVVAGEAFGLGEAGIALMTAAMGSGFGAIAPFDNPNADGTDQSLDDFPQPVMNVVGTVQRVFTNKEGKRRVVVLWSWKNSDGEVKSDKMTVDASICIVKDAFYLLIELLPSFEGVIFFAIRVTIEC